MLGRWRNSEQSGQVAALEAEVQLLRREAAENRAAQGEEIELALAGVPNTVCKLVDDARTNRWTVAFHRKPHRGGAGTIVWEHPDDPVHNCSVDLPWPDDPSEQRAKENNIRMRIGWPQPA